MSGKKILWLCSWYPNRLDPYDGDFIQRQARAASAYVNIHVIRLVPDPELKPGSVEIQTARQPNLTEQIVYIGKGKGRIGRLLYFLRWEREFRKLLKNYFSEAGRPSMVHVHVPYPAGRLAVWLKRRYRIPYIVTEHWTIYQPANPLPYSRLPLRMRMLIYSVLKEAERFLPVSTDLGKQVARLVGEVPQQVVRNVVDTGFFKYKADREMEKRDLFRFIHVSGMNEQKNPEGLLRGFAAACKLDPGMELRMVGNRDQSLKKLAKELGLTDRVVHFEGEIAYAEVGKMMQEADALVLFSQVENAPCVISEALCCGLPVIATDTGGIPEMLDDQNGILIKPGDENALKNALLELKNNISRFNRAEIAYKAAAIYNYQVVGKELSAIYTEIAG